MIKIVKGTQPQLETLIESINEFGRNILPTLGRTVTEFGIVCQRNGEDVAITIPTFCEIQHDTIHGYYITHTDSFIRNGWKQEFLTILAQIITDSELVVETVTLTPTEPT